MPGRRRIFRTRRLVRDSTADIVAAGSQGPVLNDDGSHPLADGRNQVLGHFRIALSIFLGCKCDGDVRRGLFNDTPTDDVSRKHFLFS